ncbi:MAG: hypothetical protein KC656_06740 [Myxococcales bacterium]|nr:hypothetical protein [Myxococcales bacterium]
MLAWPERADPQPRRDAGALVVLQAGRPLLFVAKGGKSALTFGSLEGLDDAVEALKAHPFKRRIRLEKIDGETVMESPLRPALLQAGFVADYKRLELP